MRHGFTGEREDTRKPARGGLSGGVFSHVGTCENLHLVEPGGTDLLASEGSIPLVSTDF